MKDSELELMLLLNQEKSNDELKPREFVARFCEEYGIPEGYVRGFGRVIYANNISTIKELMELNAFDFLNGRHIGPKRAYELIQIREWMRKIYDM